ncbi:MAG: replication protein [Saprospiraceae bacterium]
MKYQQTFQVTNSVVDQYLESLTGSEVKLLLVIFRQTHGWVDQRTGKRKTRDWISHSQFVKKTGLSKRVISTAIQNLITKGLINASDQAGKPLPDIEDRRGRSQIYYSPNMCTLRQEHVHFFPPTCAESAHNKTNYTKLKNTKGRGFGVRSVGEIIKLFEQNMG